jgi:hypothetical protein
LSKPDRRSYSDGLADTTPQRRRTASPSTFGSCPNTRTDPPSGFNAPVIMRMAVVLPAPLGPRRTVIAPDGTTRSRSRNAGLSPNERLTPDTTTVGGAGSATTRDSRAVSVSAIAYLSAVNRPN